MTLFCLGVVFNSSGDTPKIAICGDGLISRPRMFEMKLKKACQKLDSFEHDQNMCDRLHGVCEHLSQDSVVLSG